MESHKIIWLCPPVATLSNAISQRSAFIVQDKYRQRLPPGVPQSPIKISAEGYNLPCSSATTQQALVV